jgi:DNA invertase Pin-like site-specific DNA recombinase
MKYVAYYRVSTDGQDRSGLGLEAQRAAVRKYLGGKESAAIAEYTEVESGKRSDRPQLRAALHYCLVMNATLVVAKMDRLARNAGFLLSLRDSGVEFVACDQPDASRVTVGILAVIAEEEARLISERTKAALQAVKARGVKLGGDRGYRPPREQSLRAAQAKSEKAQATAQRLWPVVRDVMAQGYSSMGDIARELNRREVPTPSRRGAWRSTMVGRVFERMEDAA